MSNDLMLDVGQANELKLAFRRANFSKEDIKRLCEGHVLTDVRNVLLGYAAITVVEHVIDCDAQPYLPDGWSIEEHQKGGAFKWDAAQVAFHLSSGQKGDKYIEGNKLRKELADKPVLNANVLDYLLANPHLIPEEWKKDGKGNTRYIFFWSTIYRNRDGYLYVRCLSWGDGRWDWGNGWLDDDWFGNFPAAVRAS